MGIIAATNWRWHEVDDLTLDQVAAMNRYWEKHPPLHLMVAAYFGIGIQSNPKKLTDKGNMGELIGMLSGMDGAKVNL